MTERQEFGVLIASCSFLLLWLALLIAGTEYIKPYEWTGGHWFLAAVGVSPGIIGILVGLVLVAWPERK